VGAARSDSVGESRAPRRQRFVDEYLLHLNATKAAIAAGYSKKTAPSQGARLLKDAKVAAAIQAAKDARAARVDITQDRVLQELGLLAFSSIEHYDVDDHGNVTPKDNAPAGAIRAIASIKRKIFRDNQGNVTTDIELRLWDKPGPLKLAGQHVGLFTEKREVELTGKDGGPLEVAGLEALKGLTGDRLAEALRNLGDAKDMQAALVPRALADDKKKPTKKTGRVRSSSLPGAPAKGRATT